MAYDGQVVINTKLNSKGLESGIKGLEGVTQKSLNRIKSMIGTAAISALVAKGVNEILSSTSALDTAMAKASTLFGEVEVDSGMLEGSLISLSSASGLAADKIGQSLYNALSAGVEVTKDMAEATMFMEKNARLAKAGLSDIDTTVTATAKVLNAYKLGVEETDRIHKVLMQTQNKGITTVGELGGVLAQVTPTAAAFNVQFEEIGTQLSILTKNGTPAAQAVTQINQMLSELGKSGTIASTNLMDASEAAGKGRKSFKELVDEGMSVGEILDMVRSYAEANNLSMVDMFSSIDAGKGALAIASAGLETYTARMADMSTESDVVTEAYKKVMGTFEEQSGRLGIALQNAGTIMGSQLLPRITPIVSGLADTINKMSGATSASDSLTTNLNDLVTANEEYERILDGVQGGVEGFTQAQLDAAAATRAMALASLTQTYQESRIEVDKNSSSISNLEQDISSYNDELDTMASRLGVTREQLASMASSGELASKRLPEYQRIGMTVGEVYASTVKNLGNATTALAGFLSQETQYNSLRIQYAQSLAQAYVDGTDTILMYKDADKELYDLGMNYVLQITERTRAQEYFNSLTVKSEREARALVSTYEKLAASHKDNAYYAEMLSLAQAKLAEMTGEATKTTGDASDATADSTDIMEAYQKALAKADAIFKVTADDQKYLSDRINATEGAMVALLLNGVEPTDAAYISLSRTLGELRAQVKGDEVAVYDATKAYDEALKAVVAVDTAHGLLGDSVDVSAEKQGVLTQAIRDMIANGVDPANEKLHDLIAMLNDIPDSTKTAAEGFGKFTDDIQKEAESWDDFFYDSSQTLYSSFGNAFSALGQQLATQKSQIEDLGASITGVEDQLADAYDSLTEAQEDYADAVLSGDSDAIKSAKKRIDQQQKIVDGYEDQKKALEDEKKAVESGEKAWQEFGKAVLYALADVLDGLGAELAARAVLAALSFNWVGAGLATVAAAAAFTASGVVRGYAGSYADGGIVPGTSYSGDRMVANVNSGELILNAAQQDHIASQLAMFAHLTDLLSSLQFASHGGINVDLRGSTFNDMSEEAVGKAIYRNVKSLQAEGVLPRW